MQLQAYKNMALPFSSYPSTGWPKNWHIFVPL